MHYQSPGPSEGIAASVFNTSLGIWWNANAWKTMFDPYLITTTTTIYFEWEL